MKESPEKPRFRHGGFWLEYGPGLPDTSYGDVFNRSLPTNANPRVASSSAAQHAIIQSQKTGKFAQRLRISTEFRRFVLGILKNVGAQPDLENHPAHRGHYYCLKRSQGRCLTVPCRKMPFSISSRARTNQGRILRKTTQYSSHH
jgi:hypothetical protein